MKQVTVVVTIPDHVRPGQACRYLNEVVETARSHPQINADNMPPGAPRFIAQTR